MGQGAYGMVHRVTERLTGQSRVMKTVVRPDGWDDERLKLEAPGSIDIVAIVTIHIIIIIVVDITIHMIMYYSYTNY